MSASGLGRVKTVLKRREFWKPTGLVSGHDGGDQRLDPDDIHYSDQIIGQDRLGPSRRPPLRTFWLGSASRPCEPSSCRTDARPFRDAGAWLVGLHQGAAARLRADAHAPIEESAAPAV